MKGFFYLFKSLDDTQSLLEFSHVLGTPGQEVIAYSTVVPITWNPLLIPLAIMISHNHCESHHWSKVYFPLLHQGLCGQLQNMAATNHKYCGYNSIHSLGILWQVTQVGCTHEYSSNKNQGAWHYLRQSNVFHWYPLPCYIFIFSTTVCKMYCNFSLGSSNSTSQTHNLSPKEGWWPASLARLQMI